MGNIDTSYTHSVLREKRQYQVFLDNMVVEKQREGYIDCTTQISVWKLLGFSFGTEQYSLNFFYPFSKLLTFFFFFTISYIFLLGFSSKNTVKRLLTVWVVVINPLIVRIDSDINSWSSLINYFYIDIFWKFHLTFPKGSL